MPTPDIEKLRELASEMLAALTALYEACERRANEEGGDFGDDIGPAAELADAAIAKAALLDSLPSPVSVPAAVIRAVICAHEQFASVADYAALTVDCARCSGAGYHHGFGEHGHDPDWCTECGGGGSALNEAAYDAAEIAFITQSLAQAPFPVPLSSPEEG